VTIFWGPCLRPGWLTTAALSSSSEKPLMRPYLSILFQPPVSMCCASVLPIYVLTPSRANVGIKPWWSAWKWVERKSVLSKLTSRDFNPFSRTSRHSFRLNPVSMTRLFPSAVMTYELIILRGFPGSGTSVRYRLGKISSVT